MTIGSEKMGIVISDSVLERILREDVHYIDLTTYSLGIDDSMGVARVYFREPGIAACIEEAARIYELAGARAEPLVRSGEEVERNQLVLEARGKASSLHLAWRASQTMLSYMSGVATYTHMMIGKARRVNPSVVIATTRQTPPGARELYFKAVISGGGVIHRQSLSDSILIFNNHLVFVEEPRVKNAVQMAVSRSGGRGVGVEVSSLDEAIDALSAGAYYIQFDRAEPESLSLWVKELRKRFPQAIIGVAGGITLENVEKYASTGVDLIVTSAPYRSRPVDVTTKMEKA